MATTTVSHPLRPLKKTVAPPVWATPLFLVLLATNGALFLPFLGKPGLGTVRWIVFVSLVVILMAIYFGTMVRGMRRLGDFYYLFLAAAGIRLLSANWSVDPFYTLLRAISLIAMVFLISYVVGALVTRFHLRALNSALVLWIFLLIVPGLVLYAFGIKTAPFSDFEMEKGLLGRYSGVLGNPNQIAICGAVMGPIVLATWLDTRRWWLIALYLAILISIYLSGSRSGAVTQIAAMICVPAFAARRVSRGVVIALFFAICLLNPVVLEEARSYFARGDHASLEEISANRTSRWVMGYQSIKKRPVFGQGYGIGGVPMSGADPTEVDWGYPLHNSYLQLLQENGIIGAVPIFILLGALAVALFKRRISVRPEDRFLYAGFAAAFVCGAISAFFESWLVSVGNLGTMPFWLCTAVVWYLSRTPRSQSEQARRRSPAGAGRRPMRVSAPR